RVGPELPPAGVDAAVRGYEGQPIRSVRAAQLSGGPVVTKFRGERVVEGGEVGIPGPLERTTGCRQSRHDVARAVPLPTGVEHFSCGRGRGQAMELPGQPLGLCARLPGKSCPTVAVKGDTR